MREDLNQGLIEFLKASPTPFHATTSLAQRLEAAGFQHLDERASWHTEAGGRYYVTRNDSSIIAFKLGKRAPLEGGIRLVGAHTDSPCLRCMAVPCWRPGSTATCPWPVVSRTAAMARWKAS